MMLKQNKENAMITPFTQTALTVLNDIAYRELSSRYTSEILAPHTLPELLACLESHGLIRLLPGKVRTQVLSYELTRPAGTFTLLDVLEATGEHLNCNQEVSGELYLRYGVVARKLGIISQITRQYLSEIKLTDL